MSEAPLFVGLDLGTSALKGVAMSAGGDVVATASAGYPTERRLPGRAEQDPADWWSALVEVVAALTATTAVDRWAGVGLSGMLPTLVLAARDGSPIGPAITWEDDRADAEGAAFRAEVGEDALYRATGQWVDGRYLLPMVRWLAREEPALVEGAAWILGAKDLLVARLTGEPATDPSTAAGSGCFGLAEGAWDAALAGPWGERLPEVAASITTRGLVPQVAAELGVPAGLPVSVGAADSVCGVVGAGAGAAGDRVSLWGTSTAIVGINEERLLDPEHRFLVTPLALGARWGLEMDLVSTGSAISWCAALLGVDEREVFELAAAAPLGAGGVSFLPYLGPGEQGALWEPSLRGTIGGLTLTHARGHLARALVEGITLEVRRCTRVLDDVGVPPGPLVMAGGAAGSSTFAATIASATGHAVLTIEDGRWVSARGAAIVAAASAGVDPGSIPGPPRTAHGPAGDAARWEELADRHDDLLRRIR